MIKALLPFNDELEVGEDSPTKLELLRSNPNLPARVEQAANWVKFRELELEAAKAKLKPLIEQLQAELRFHEQRYEFAKTALECLLPPGEKSSFEGENVSIYYSPSYSVDVTDPESLPLEFVRIQQEADKQAIKDQLKAGREISGARMLVNWNLKIGAGGAKGKHNKKQRERQRQIID